MAVLFSAVTLTADNNQVEFLAAGIPRDADDLEGWTAYENFMSSLKVMKSKIYGSFMVCKEISLCGEASRFS